MILSAALAALVLSAPPEQPQRFEFRDGDRVVWIGGTLVEREQRYGYWESLLLAANADKKITFRNLGWSGDTVHAEARGRFDFADAEKCFKQLVNLTLELKPTVIFISYGTNESFEGKDGLPKFEKGLEKLLDALKPANARVVLFSAPPFEAVPGAFDEAARNARNASLTEYNRAVRDVAERRGVVLADLAYGFENLRVLEKRTENGMHLTERGYKLTAHTVPNALTMGLASGMKENAERLRPAVVAKNELFFHRWRPQNETYLFGFRKHEQGKNAKEVAEFDPLVAKAEEEIEKIRKAIK